MRTKLLGGVGLATIAVAIAAGCSGKSSGASNKVVGTIMGGTFTAASGSFATYPIATGETVTVGFLSTDPNFCDSATANAVEANSKIMLFEFGTATSDTNLAPASVAGDYTVVDLGTGATTIPPMFFGGEYAMFDNSCNLPTASSAFITTGGTGFVDITKVSTTAIDGKDPIMSFESGDSVQMSMALKPCPGMLAPFTGSVSPTCLVPTGSASAATAMRAPHPIALPLRH